MSIRIGDKLFIQGYVDNKLIRQIYVDNNLVWNFSTYTYSTGTLPTGVASLTCYRSSSPWAGASTGEIADGGHIFFRDELYWTATAYFGYTASTTYNSSSNTKTVHGDITGSSYVSATPITYRLMGSSSHSSSIKFYSTGSVVEEVSNAEYGDTVSYVIIADTGYNAPSSGTVTIINTDPNITFTSNNAMIDLPDCTLISYTYRTGTLPTGISSLTCYRVSSPIGGASAGVVADGDPIYRNDTLYWTVTTIFGYTATLTYDSSSNTLTVSGDVTGSSYVSASANTYNIVGASADGTVKFYSTGGVQQEITQAVYGDTIAYFITANTGYDRPSNYSGTIVFNDTNFSFLGNTGRRTFDPCTVKTFTYYEGTLSTGLASITCYRSASPKGGALPGNLTNGATIYYDDELNLSGIANTGYVVSSSITNPLIVTNDVTGSNYITATPKTYNLMGTSTNGSVTFYSTGGTSQQITTAEYGDTVSYHITANHGYDSPGDGSITLTTSNPNITFTGNNAMINLPACTIKSVTQKFTITTGVRSVTYTLDNTNWNTITSTTTINSVYGNTLKWYATAETHYSLASGTPTSSSPATITLDVTNPDVYVSAVPNQYGVTITNNSSATVTVTPGNISIPANGNPTIIGYFNYGSAQTITVSNTYGSASISVTILGAISLNVDDLTSTNLRSLSATGTASGSAIKANGSMTATDIGANATQQANWVTWVIDMQDPGWDTPTLSTNTSSQVSFTAMALSTPNSHTYTAYYQYNEIVVTGVTIYQN